MSEQFGFVCTLHVHSVPLIACTNFIITYRCGGPLEDPHTAWCAIIRSLS
jgi:hypothetical protein